MQYYMVHPVDTVFNTVDDLGEICSFAEAFYGYITHPTEATAK